MRGQVRPRRHPAAANQARNDICNYNNCQLCNKMAGRAGTSFTPADRATADLAAYPLWRRRRRLRRHSKQRARRPARRPAS